MPKIPACNTFRQLFDEQLPSEATLELKGACILLAERGASLPFRNFCHRPIPGAEVVLSGGTSWPGLEWQYINTHAPATSDAPTPFHLTPEVL